MEGKSLRKPTIEDLRKEILQVLRNALIHERDKQDMTSLLSNEKVLRDVKVLKDAWIHDRVKYSLEGYAEKLRNALNRDKQDTTSEEDAYSYVGLLRNVKVLRNAWNHDRDKQDTWNHDRDKQDTTSNLYEEEEEEEEEEDEYSSEKYDYEQDMTSNLYEAEEDEYSYAGLLRNVKVLRDAWIHDLDKQYMPFYEAPEEDMASNLYEAEEDEYSSEEYDYDYNDCGQEYQDMLKHRLASFPHEELPTDKKRNPTLMGKQLIIKAFEEGKDGTRDSFENSQAGKEACDALFKHFADFPRTIRNMATISHSLS